MIKTIIKVLLISSLGITILSLIPSLFLPIANALDSVLDTDLITTLTNFYSVLGGDVMALLIMQFSTLVILVIISWVFGK